MHHIEARLARRKLDHAFLALLLLGDLLRLDLDAGKLGEFLDVLLEVIAARPLGEDRLELGAGIFLPVDLRMRGKSGKAERACRRGALEQGAARDLRIHGVFLPDVLFSWVRV